MATSPPPTRSSPAPLMRSSTLTLRTAAATTASPPGRRRVATETRGTTRWRAMRGCTTSRRFPWRRPCCLRTETNWRWSTAGSPPCPHSAACCKNSTEPCLCPSGPVLIQRREGNPAASRCPGTAGSMLSWPPPLRQITESLSTTSWTGPETLVRHTICVLSFHMYHKHRHLKNTGLGLYHTRTKTICRLINWLIARKLSTTILIINYTLKSCQVIKQDILQKFQKNINNRKNIK